MVLWQKVTNRNIIECVEVYCFILQQTTLPQKIANTVWGKWWTLEKLAELLVGEQIDPWEYPGVTGRVGFRTPDWVRWLRAIFVFYCWTTRLESWLVHWPIFVGLFSYTKYLNALHGLYFEVVTIYFYQVHSIASFFICSETICN